MIKGGGFGFPPPDLCSYLCLKVKRGIKGQFHFVSPKYLSRYLDEFSFRFNNKESDFMFDKLLMNAVR